jgi:nucleotide-binding universal stress UspA family protein
MPARLTIAYDGSSSAAAAVRAAAALFPNARASIVNVPAPGFASAGMVEQSTLALSPAVVQEVLDDITNEAAEESSTIAAEGAGRATAGGLDAEVKTVAPHAPVWEALVAAARDSGADVLVTGARGRSGFTRALLGSTSTSLLHHAELPLLVVPDGAGALDGPALIAYDGSDHAKRAIDVAGKVLGGRAAVIAHVWESQFRHGLTMRALASAPGGDVREVVEALDSELAKAAESVTQDGVERARAAGLDATGETIESSGGVWRPIATAAGARGAAVIVTGARGLGGARAALLGSVSSGLVHNAELPVLVVHDV